MIRDFVNTSCQRSLHVLCSIKLNRQLNGKTKLIIVTIAYDNIVYDLYIKLLYGFLYFCILPMHVGFLFLFFFHLFSKQINCQRCDKMKKEIGPTGTRTQDLSRFVLTLNLLS